VQNDNPVITTDNQQTYSLSDTDVVILAAGDSTRMRSTTPKVLHQLAGRPLIEYSVRLAKALSS
jgi:bifunctional UDP-N-acetylglucosamine pyrophosphorylase/glucosamine-1-phosphate N-acetyltransferase